MKSLRHRDSSDHFEPVGTTAGEERVAARRSANDACTRPHEDENDGGGQGNDSFQALRGPIEEQSLDAKTS